jgi:UDP-N-acetylmuramoyl-tripeptide--D-alanyl-D-alanine ligase
MAKLGMNAPANLDQRALWSAPEVVSATGGTATADFTVTGVSIDSRTVRPGELFVALVGPNNDAHRFVPAALSNGASAAMVARPRAADMPVGAPLLLVDDTQAGLEALGHAGRTRSAARIAGITGSVGKTGTKEALRLALGAQAPTHASEASYNNLWGVPLSLARMPIEVRYGVFELGMNHAGELGPLARQVRPHVAIVTNVELAHAEFFASVEAIADAKAEIFEGLEPGGIAVLNRDNPQFERLARAAEATGAARVIGFGADPRAEARLENCALHPTLSCVTASIDGVKLAYKVGTPGRHWVLNSLAVLAAVQAMGGDLGIAGLALASLTAPKGRGRRHVLAVGDGEVTLIDESYNASPAAMRAAFDVLQATPVGPRGRRIAVLGDMRELGEQAEMLHVALAAELHRRSIDKVFAIGPLTARLLDALPAARRAGKAATATELVPSLITMVRPGDVVMVKGSRGGGARPAMEPVVEAVLALTDRPARRGGR